MTVKQNGTKTADLIPCVRNVDGAIGLWCNVYKKFYDQTPVATLMLDDEDTGDNGVTYFEPIEEIEQ